MEKLPAARRWKGYTECGRDLGPARTIQVLVGVVVGSHGSFLVASVSEERATGFFQRKWATCFPTTSPRAVHEQSTSSPRAVYDDIPMIHERSTSLLPCVQVIAAIQTTVCAYSQT